MIRNTLIFAGVLLGQLCLAQAPAGAPAGSTAQCNDGTYFNGATKSGACSGHKGVKTWWGPAKPATAAAPTKPATPPAAAAPAKPSTPAPAAPAAASAPKSTTASAAAAPGGGPNMVWLNTDSKVYHCYGTQYYGKTKMGAYMSESDAKAKGGKPNAGKPCAK